MQCQPYFPWELSEFLSLLSTLFSNVDVKTYESIGKWRREGHTLFYYGHK